MKQGVTLPRKSNLVKNDFSTSSLSMLWKKFTNQYYRKSQKSFFVVKAPIKALNNIKITVL